MILADKIIEERKKNGWSQEELAEKLSVSRQSVSKWESAQSTPDIGRIIQLAEIFSVSTDYLLKDNYAVDEEKDFYVPAEDNSTNRMVSMEEANEFLNLKEINASKVAAGVFMCIVCPCLVIILSGLAEAGMFFSEGLAAGIGITVLLAMVAFAVYLFITTGISESKFEYLEKEPIETAYGVSGLVKEKKKNYEPVFTRGIALGVVLCIISTVPVVVAGAMELDEYILDILAAFLLLLIAAGVYIIVKTSIIAGSYKMLLQEGDYSLKEKNAKRRLDPIAGIYWSIITAIYLGISFWTSRWDFTWIIWPVFAVVYGALITILRVTMKIDE